MGISVTKLDYIKMLKGGASNLYQNRKIVNDLNVFPVPDGDTGDNMYSTIAQGVSKIDEDASFYDIVRMVSKGMLLGARGNSGVILSKIAAGISKCPFGLEEINGECIKVITEKAIEESYNAVMNPQEGTILTVFREASRYANGLINEDSTIESYLDNFIMAANKAVEQTPELLPVLKEAGVVDSGGVGIVYIAQGMRYALENEDVNIELNDIHNKNKLDLSLFNENSVLDYGYCTEFLLQLQRSKIDIDNFDRESFSDYLKDNGNSVVSFFEGSIFKVHVHTAKPGEILNHYQQFGEFLTVKIENMSIQHSNKEVDFKKNEKKKFLGIVAVASGEGIKNMFMEMGVDYVIAGGQSSNPSVSDFYAAFNQINAENIIVLPNNSNIILAAKQASETYKKANIIVISSHDIGEGYAALSVIDFNEKDIDVIVHNASNALETVETYSICKAIRDTRINGIKVYTGEYFSFSGKKDIYYSSSSRYHTADNLIKDIIGPSSVVIIIYGNETSEEEVNKLVHDCELTMKSTEFIVIKGKQPVYDYIVIKED